MVSDSRGRILSDKESQTDAVQKIQKECLRSICRGELVM